MKAKTHWRGLAFCAALATSLLPNHLLAQLNPPDSTLPTTSSGPGATPTGPGTSAGPGAYSIVDRGPHHKVWQRTVFQTNAFNGTVHALTNSYTELSTASSRQLNGAWVDTSEQIEVTATGAQATNGYHSVQFLGNLNASGSVSVTTPEGKKLVSNILGLSYWDYTTTNSVWIATSQDSFGQLMPSGDRALYTNAMNGLSVDVLYINTRDKFEQLAIVKQQLPDPASFQMNPETTVLQIVTEFSNPPPPLITQSQAAAGPDDYLDFGIMSMPRGFAFAAGSETNKIGATKRWAVIDGRNLLFEQIQFTAVQPLLSQLPPPPIHAAVQPQPGSVLYRLASRPILPPKKLVLNKTPSLLLAKATPELKGLVADYTLVTSQSNFTFAAGQTYFVTNFGINLSGTTILEAAVIKFSSSTNNWPTLTVYGPLRCQTGPYQMAILTSQDDNSVGDSITGSTGSPVIRNAFCFNAQGPGTTNLDWNIKYIRCSYAQAAFVSYDGLDLTARHCQIVNCINGIGALSSGSTAANVNVQNCLFDLCSYPVYCDGNIRAVNVTAVAYTNFCDSDAGILGLAVTNSIMVGSGWAKSEGSTTNLPAPTLDHTAAPITSAGLFQSAGAGSFYLVDNSTNRNSGNPNIDSTLRSDLARRTTYPPLVVAAGEMTGSNFLSPTALRDTDAPDIGFEYDPIDYLFLGSTLDPASFTIQPGTAIGFWVPGGYGLFLRSGSTLQAVGSATSPVIFADANTVQEEPAGSAYAFIFTEPSTADNPVQGFYQFTKSYGLGSEPFHFQGTQGASGSISFGFSSCEFYGGAWQSWYPSLGITNCLFQRVATDFEDGGNPLSVYNCLFHVGSCTVNWAGSSTWVLQNNAFDHPTISRSSPPATTYDHNAYIGVANYLGSSLQTGDIPLTSIVWAAGPLGSWYQPSTNSLCNAGSITADQLELFHFTVTTNFINNLEIKETNSVVDMSYHYVAVGTNGLPISTSGDGWGDYLLDANGNGNPNDDLLSWTNYNSPNGLTSANGLQVFTPLK